MRRNTEMKTTVCHKPGCYSQAVPGKHFCIRHIQMEAQWGKSPSPQRKESSAWHNLYASARWKRERRAFLREYPACAVCGKPAVVVDHIQPHRGNELLFWDHFNWQPLCWKHHSAKTLEENGYFRGDRGIKNNPGKGDDQHAPSFACTCVLKKRG